MSTASEVARSGPRAQPRICCLDLDTFFVSVERVLDPTLEGKPVVVGGQPGTRGVVTAASSELELYPILKEMLAAARTRPLRVRLLGVQLSNLGVYEQLSLFDHHEKAGAVVDQIRERYGFSMVALATQLGGAGKKLVGRRSVGRGG